MAPFSMELRAAPLSGSRWCFAKYIITSCEFELEERVGCIDLRFVSCCRRGHSEASLARIICFAVDSGYERLRHLQR